MKNFKAFTLIEVMVCIILTAVVAFFIYTMMLSAHKTYFKLFSISRQRNDIRYFETLMRRSIHNAQYYSVDSTGKKLQFKYYDSKANKYRMDEYDCSNILEFDDENHIKVNSFIMGKTSAQIKDMYSGNGSPITLNVYEGSGWNSLSKKSTEIILNNVNKMYFVAHSEPSTTDFCNFAVVFNRELDDGERNYEYMIYTVSMRNTKYIDLSSI